MVKLAQELIGKVIFTKIDGCLCAAIITETEAYAGINDKASHAYGNKRTKRTETMYLEGGHAYIYLIYGIHHLFNVVTNKENIPHAVLIRGAYPIIGQSNMKLRASKKLNNSSLVGPGRFSKLMGISTQLNAIELHPKQKNAIWLEDWGLNKKLENYIQTTKRIGIDYAEEDALLPFRFFIPLKSKTVLSILEEVGKPIDY